MAEVNATINVEELRSSVQKLRSASNNISSDIEQTKALNSSVSEWWMSAGESTLFQEKLGTVQTRISEFNAAIESLSKSVEMIAGSVEQTDNEIASSIRTNG